MSEWVVLLHVATAFWFVGGLIGRWVALSRARAVREIRIATELVELAGRFERWMVQPGSFAVVIAGLLAAWAADLPWTGEGNWWLLTSLILFVSVGLLVPLVFIPRGKVFEAALERAKQGGEVTPELTAAFGDALVSFARIYEVVAVGAIVVLMVTKPF
ncbi:MAG TPA: DUF2269 family protein [Actinomycetota bacterium]|nr:DUF2269 family protein [Actinomycetota bacterium]